MIKWQTYMLSSLPSHVFSSLPLPLLNYDVCTFPFPNINHHPGRKAAQLRLEDLKIHESCLATGFAQLPNSFHAFQYENYASTYTWWFLADRVAILQLSQISAYIDCH